MQEGGKLLPLVDYGSIWLYIAIALWILVLAWIGFVFYATRKPRATSSAYAVRKEIRTIDKRKQTYVAYIQAAKNEYDQGKISERVLYHKISIIVRTFASEMTGRPIDKMILSDLKKDPDCLPIARLIGGFYPDEFGPVATKKSVEAPISEAKKVVMTWN